MNTKHNEIERLYRQHGPALLLFAIAMTGERSRAQDALHQVFAKLLERADLDDVLNLKAYLFQCVRNAVLNDSRATARNVSLGEEGAWFEVLNREYSEEVSLRRALSALPSEQRQVTILRIWGGFTNAEIAELLLVSPNTVASRYRYALGKLREAMGVKEDSCADACG